jgi:cobalamin biosynthesis Co2+ chelatase CbiK
VTERRTIVLSAHGSREPAALATFEHFQKTIQHAFPGHPVVLQFSDYILQKLRAENKADWVGTLRSSSAEPVADSVTQSLLVAPEILSDPKPIAEMLEPEISDEQTAYLLCGHGSQKHPERNQPLINLYAQLHPNHPNLFLATLDGPPGNKQPLEKIRTAGFARVHFIPVLFASGFHIHQDIMGDEPASWKSRIGLPATIAPPLGDRPEIAQLLIERIRQQLNCI